MDRVEANQAEEIQYPAALYIAIIVRFKGERTVSLDEMYRAAIHGRERERERGRERRKRKEEVWSDFEQIGTDGSSIPSILSLKERKLYEF